MKNYIPLTRQQRYVLGQVYDGLINKTQSLRWNPTTVLRGQHDCPTCRCAYIDGRRRIAFQEDLREAEMSSQVKDIFALWGNAPEHTSTVALFGERNDGSIVLIGEYPAQGSVLTYTERLLASQTKYNDGRGFRKVVKLASLVVALLAAVFITFLIRSGFNDPYGIALPLLIFGSLFEVVCLANIISNFRLRRLLFPH